MPDGVEQRTPLSGINDPTSELYQALVNFGEGIAIGSSIEGLPSISVDTAVRLTAVYRAVQILCTPATLPLDIFERDDRGNRVEVMHPEDRAWWGRPNPMTTREQFWKTSFAHNALAGETFHLMFYSPLGQVVERWPIHPKRVEVFQDPGTLHKWFRVDGEWVYRDAASAPVGSSDPKVLHTPNLSLDGLRGVGPIQAMRMALQLSRAHEEMAGSRLANGAVPAGVITTEADLQGEDGEAAIKRLKSQWNSMHRGVKNAGRVAVLDNGGKFQAISLSAQDLQFLDQRRFQVQEIARMFGIPPHLLADSSNSTSWGSGLEEQGRALIIYTLSDYTNRFEATDRDYLNYVNTRGRPKYVKWNYGGLLRGSLAQRYQAYGLAYNKWLTRGDIRRLEDLPTSPDDDLWGLPGTAADEGQAAIAREEFGQTLRDLVERVRALEQEAA